MKFNKGKGHLRIGRLLVTSKVHVLRDSPWIDGCSTTLTHDDGRKEHFGGLALRVPRMTAACSVGWLGHRVPNPLLWRPKYVYRHLRWVLAGRPISPPMTTGHDFEAQA